MKKVIYLFSAFLLGLVLVNAQTTNLPFTENFDSESQGSTSCGASVTLSNAYFSNVSGDNGDWSPDRAGTGSSGTGPSIDHTTGTSTGYYLYTETSGCYNRPYHLESVYMNWTSQTSVDVSWWYHMQGSAMGTMHFDIRVGNGAWVLDYVPSWTDNQNLWQQKLITINSPTYAGQDSVQIRVRGISGTSFTSDMAVDDITVEASPACAGPTGLSSSNITSSSADLDWTENNGSTTWNLEYGPAGFTQGSGTAVTISSKPHSLTGLSATTAYDWYVRSDCGASGTSAYSSGSFSTTFNAPPALNCTGGGSASTIFSEEFDNLNSWTGNIGTGTTLNNWNVRTGGTGSSGTGPNGAHSGSNYIYVETSGAGIGTSVAIVSQAIDLTSASTGVSLSFWFHAFGGQIGTLNVGAGTSASGPFTNVFTNTGQVQTSNAAAFLNPGADLTSYIGQTIYLQIEYITNSGFAGDIALDLLEVSTCVSCALPTGLTTSNLTATSVDLGWTDPNGSSQWEIEYGPSGFTPGTGTTVNVSSNPYSLSGLSSETTYDWYIKSDCGGSGLSPAASGSFTTLFQCPAGAVCGTYTNGGIASDYSFQTLPGFSSCSGSLTLVVPSGNRIDSLDTYYEVTAASGAFMSEQRSYLYSPTTSLGETSLYSGVGSSGGTYTYSRDNLTFANGGIDTVLIEMHLGRMWGGSGCNASYNQVDDGTWRVVAYYSAIPACPEPNTLTTTNLVYNAADLGWTEIGSSTNWQISYGASGFTAGTGTQIVTSTNPISISGLTGNTSYDWYVRAICAPGDTSAWSLVNSFTTPFAPQVAPWSDDFESHATTTNSTINTNGWSSTPNNTTSSFRWNIDGSGSTPSSNTGPTGANSGSNYLYTEASSGGTTAELISPSIDLSALSVPRLTFSYHMYGATMGNLSVDVYDGTSWNNGVFTLIGQQQTAAADPWLKATVDLSTYSGTIQIRFTATKGSSYTGDMSIDDFVIEESPSCLEPNSLTENNVTPDTAYVSWTDLSGASEWILEYGTSSFSLGSGTQIIANSTNYAISGLTATTAYDWYVKAVCVPGSDSSNWSSVSSFETPCNAFTAPYSDNFSSYTINQEADCWKSYNTYNALANTWVRNLTGATSSPYSSPNALYLYSYTGYVSSTDTLAAISPQFSDMTAGDKRVSFQTATSSTLNSLLVGTVSSPENPASFVPLDTITYSATGSYTQYFIELTTANGYNGSHQYIVFAHGLGSTYTYVMIDDFIYEAIPACNNPSAFAASNITGSSLDLSWTNGGTETTWEIEYDTAGFTQGTGTMVSTTTNPHSISGLNPITAYEFYIRAVCDEKTKSPWTGPLSITTGFPAPRTLACGGSSVLNNMFTEEFDNTNFWTGDIGTGTTARKWNRKSGTTSSSNTGPNGAHSGSNYLYYEASSGVGTQATIVSNAINLTNVTSAELSFWMHAYGASMGTFNLNVGTSPTGPFTSVFTWGAEFQTANADPWVNVGINLDAYAGQTIYLQMDMIHGSSFYGDMAFDKFEIDACLLPCENPTGLNARFINNTSARLVWNEIPGASYKVKYRPITGGPWTVLNRATSTPRIDVTGLTPNTKYIFNVRSNCDAGWSQSVPWGSFSTLATSCDIPTNPFTDGIVTDRARVNWDSMPSSVKYRVRYRAQGGGAWTKFAVSSGNHKFITGLSPNTTYEWQVKNVCQYGQVAGTVWSSLQTFTTNPLARFKVIAEESEELKERISIYPNPNKGAFNISMNLASEVQYTLELKDVTGRVLRNESLTGTGQNVILPIDLENAKGVYLLRISNGEETTVKRIVVN